MTDEAMKRCPKCREIKPISEFTARRDKPEKVLPGCTSCRKAKGGGSGMKRTQMKPMSDKRRDVNIKRKAAMIIAFGDPRTWKCQIGETIGTPCFGEVHGHEILSRSRSGRRDENLLDMTGVLLACDYHNGWLEDNPKVAHELGLTRHSWE